MIQLRQADIAIHQCTFQAYFEKAKINLRFPSLFFVEWKTINGQNSVNMVGRKKANNSTVQFKQSLTFTTQIIFHRTQKHYLKKQSLLHLNLISNSRPDQIKLVGRILLNLAQTANYQKYEELTVQKLTFCSVDGYLEFKIKMISSFQSQKQFNQLDKSSFNDLYSLLPSNNGSKKQNTQQKNFLHQRRQNKSKSKIHVLKQTGYEYNKYNYQNNHILVKQFGQPNSQKIIKQKKGYLKNVQTLQKNFPLNSIQSDNLQILIKKQKQILQKELNQHKNRIKKLQTDINEIMKSYKQTQQKSEMTSSKLLFTQNVVNSLKENEDKIKLSLKQKQNEIYIIKAGYEADIKILKGTIEELKISITQNNDKRTKNHEQASHLQSLRNQFNNKQFQCLSLQAQIQKIKSQHLNLIKKCQELTIENQDLYSQFKKFQEIIKQKNEGIVNANNLLKQKEENYSLVVGQFQQKLKDALNQLSIVQEESHRHLITTSEALIGPNNKINTNPNQLLYNQNNLKIQFDNLKAKGQKLQRQLSEKPSSNQYLLPASSQHLTQIFILKEQHEIESLQINSLKQQNLLLKQKINLLIADHQQLVNLRNHFINGIQSKNLVNEEKQQPIIEQQAQFIAKNQQNLIVQQQNHQQRINPIKEQLLKQKSDNQKDHKVQLKERENLLGEENNKVIQGQMISSNYNKTQSVNQSSSLFTFAQINQNSNNNLKEISQSISQQIVQENIITENLPANSIIPELQAQIVHVGQDYLQKINQSCQILQKSFDNHNDVVPPQHNFIFQQHAAQLSHEQVNNLAQKITINEEELQYLKCQNLKLNENINQISLKCQENSKLLQSKQQQNVIIRQEKATIEDQLTQISNKYDQLKLQLQNNKILHEGEQQKQKYMRCLQQQIKLLRQKVTTKQNEEKKLLMQKLDSLTDRQFLIDLQNRLSTQQHQNRMKDQLLAEGEKNVQQLYALKYELVDLKQKYQQIKEALDERDQIINYLQETKEQLSKELQQIQKNYSFKTSTQTQMQESQLKIIQGKMISLKTQNQFIKNQLQNIKNQNQSLKHENYFLIQKVQIIDNLDNENKGLRNQLQYIIIENQKLKREIGGKQSREENAGSKVAQELKNQIISSLKTVKQGLEAESEALKVQQLPNINRTVEQLAKQPQLSNKLQLIVQPSKQNAQENSGTKVAQELKNQIISSLKTVKQGLEAESEALKVQQLPNINRTVEQLAKQPQLSNKLQLIVQPSKQNAQENSGTKVAQELKNQIISSLKTVKQGLEAESEALKVQQLPNINRTVEQLAKQPQLSNKLQLIVQLLKQNAQENACHSNTLLQNLYSIKINQIQSQRSQLPIQHDHSVLPYDDRQLYDHIAELKTQKYLLQQQIESLTSQLSKQSQQKFIYFNELQLHQLNNAQLQQQIVQLKQQINKFNSLPLNSFDTSQSPIKNDLRANTQTVLQQDGGAIETSIMISNKVKAQNSFQTPSNKTQTQFSYNKKQGETNISTQILDEELQKVKRQYQLMKQQLQITTKSHNQLKVLYEIDQQRYTSLSIHYENCLKEIQFINYNLTDLTNQKASLNQQLNYFKNKVITLQKDFKNLNSRYLQLQQRRQQPQMIIQIKQQLFDSKQGVKLQKIIIIDQMIIPAAQNKEPICQITIQNVEKSVETINEIITGVQQKQKVTKEEIMIVEQVVSERPIEPIQQNNNNITQKIQQFYEPVIAVSLNLTPQILLPQQKTQQSIKQPIHINQIQIKNLELSQIKKYLNQLKFELQLKQLQIAQLKLIAQQHNACLIERHQWQQKLNQISQKLSEDELILLQKKITSIQKKDILPQSIGFEDHEQLQEQHRLILTNNGEDYKTELEALRNEKLEYMESVVKLQSKLNQQEVKNQGKITLIENSIKNREVNLQELKFIIQKLTKETQQLKLKVSQKQFELSEQAFKTQTDILTKLDRPKQQSQHLKQSILQCKNIIQTMSLEMQHKQVQIANKIEEITNLQLQIDELKNKTQLYQEIINNYKVDELKYAENNEKIILSQEMMSDLHKQIIALKAQNQEKQKQRSNNLISASQVIIEDHKKLQIQEQYRLIKQKYQMLSLQHTKISQQHKILQQEGKILNQGHNILDEMHKMLSQEYKKLLQNHSMLKEEYKVVLQELQVLQQRHRGLNQEFITLQQENIKLNADYKAITLGHTALTQDFQVLLKYYNEIKIQLAQKEETISKTFLQLQKQKAEIPLKTSQQQLSNKKQSLKNIQQQNLSIKIFYQLKLKQKQEQLLSLIKQYNGLKAQNHLSLSKVKQLAFKEKQMKNVILLIEGQTNKIIENIKIKEIEQEILWNKFYQKERQCSQLLLSEKLLVQESSNKDRNTQLLEQQLKKLKRNIQDLRHQYEQTSISPQAITIQYQKYDQIIQQNDKILTKNKEYIDLLNKKSGLSVQNQKLKYQISQQNYKIQQLSINLSNLQFQYNRITSQYTDKISNLTRQKQQLMSQTIQLIKELQSQKVKKIEEYQSNIFGLILQKNKEIQQLKNNYRNNVKQNQDKNDNSILNEQFFNLNRQLLEKEGEMNRRLLEKDQEINKIKEGDINKNIKDIQFEIQSKMKKQLEERILKEEQLKSIISSLEHRLKMLENVSLAQNKLSPKQQIVNDKQSEFNGKQKQNINTVNNYVNPTTNIDNVNLISADLQNICQQIKQLYNKRNSLTNQPNDPLLNNINTKYQQFQQQFFNLYNQTYFIQQKARFIAKELQKIKSAIVKSQNKAIKQKTQLLALLKPCENAASQLINLSQTLSERQSQCNP